MVFLHVCIALLRLATNTGRLNLRDTAGFCWAETLLTRSVGYCVLHNAIIVIHRQGPQIASYVCTVLNLQTAASEAHVVERPAGPALTAKMA
jgi:hypothetical protein